MTDDKSGRPISFAFAGKTAHSDGAEVRLPSAMLKASVNYKQMRDGFAYPLYYNILFADLRAEFTKVLRSAKQADRGYWPKDAIRSGVVVTSKDSLAPSDPSGPNCGGASKNIWVSHAPLLASFRGLSRKMNALMSSPSWKSAGFKIS